MPITAEIVDQIKAGVNCCACGCSMRESETINLCATKKMAPWEFPVQCNAVAIVCDDCIAAKRRIVNVVEMKAGPDGFNEVIYHKIEELEDIPSPAVN